MFHNFSRVLLINVLLLVGLAIPVELIFGSWIYGPNFGSLNIPRKVTRHFDTSKIYQGGGKMQYVRDEYGLRGTYDDISSLDILVMGGSTTDEKFVDEGKTWVDVLRNRFAADGTPLQVVNAAIDGHSTFGHNWSFDVWFPLIPDIRARYVLAYVGINDAAAIKANKYDLMKSRNWQKKVRYFFLNNSALYHLFRTIRGNIRARSAHLVHGDGKFLKGKWFMSPKPPNFEAPRLENKEVLEAYSERIKILAENIRTFGAEPIFITQPRGSYRIRNGKIFGKKGNDGTVNVMSYVMNTLYNRQLMETCADVRGICIDLADGFSFEDGDVYDHIHTTPQGSKKVGEAIYERLKDLITPAGAAAL